MFRVLLKSDHLCFSPVRCTSHSKIKCLPSSTCLFISTLLQLWTELHPIRNAYTIHVLFMYYAIPIYVMYAFYSINKNIVAARAVLNWNLNLKRKFLNYLQITSIHGRCAHVHWPFLLPLLPWMLFELYSSTYIYVYMAHKSFVLLAMVVGLHCGASHRIIELSNTQEHKPAHKHSHNSKRWC